MKNNNEITYDTFCAGSTKKLFFNIQAKTQQGLTPADLSGFTANIKVYKFGLPNNILIDDECMISASKLGLVIYDLKPSDTIDFSEGVYCVQLTLVDTSNSFVYKRHCNWYVQEKISRDRT